jgi:hypothetical protein
MAYLGFAPPLPCSKRQSMPAEAHPQEVVMNGVVGTGFPVPLEFFYFVVKKKFDRFAVLC